MKKRMLHQALLDSSEASLQAAHDYMVHFVLVAGGTEEEKARAREVLEAAERLHDLVRRPEPDGEIAPLVLP